MATVVLRSVGGSVVMAVPRKILNLVHLDAGSRVEVSVEKGRLVIDPKPKPKYTLAELLAKTKPSDFRLTKEDREWLDDPPSGKEKI